MTTSDRYTELLDEGRTFTMDGFSDREILLELVNEQRKSSIRLIILEERVTKIYEALDGAFAKFGNLTKMPLFSAMFGQKSSKKKAPKELPPVTPLETLE